MSYVLLTSPAEPEARFDSLEALAARLQALRAGRPIRLTRAVVTTSERQGGRQCVAVHLAEDGLTLGYAIVGEPPLSAGAQYDLIGGALARLNPELEDAA